jgi:hypothetical protein
MTVVVCLALMTAGCERSSSTQPYELTKPVRSTASLTAVPSQVVFTPAPSKTKKTIPVSATLFPSGSSSPVESTYPASTLTAVTLLAVQTRLVFPLQPANSWVYDYQAYSLDEQASWQVVDTMLEARSYGSLEAVRILHEVQLVKGSPSANFINRPVSGSFWYVLDGSRVFRQDELNWSTVSNSWLELIWPFPEGSCWYPEGAQRSEKPVTGRPGCRYAQGPLTIQTPAGRFDKCYSMLTPYNNGTIQLDFCPQIGIVGGKYQHSGTAFGYQYTLTAYSLQNK